MRKSAKIWLIAAGSLVLLGCIVFAGVMTTLKWDFTELSTVRYETNIYEPDEKFGDISITSDTADIEFTLSDDGKCRVECYEAENAENSVAVQDGTLVIESSEQKARPFYVGFCFDSPKITVYLPKTEYNALSVKESTGNIEIPKNLTFESVDISLSTGGVDFRASASSSVKIRTTTGNINIEDISAGSLELSVTTGTATVSGVICQDDITIGASTGKAFLSDVSCKSIISKGTTGDISLSNAIAAEKLSVERSTGNVAFNACDAAEIYVKTDTGDVTGSLLSGKTFITNTHTGSIDVPKTSNGGRCEINTHTGDVGITID